MKYAIVLPDGAADEPVAQLGGRTPLEVANIPRMDWIASHGQVGRVVTIPMGFVAGTDVATLTIFGYDPLKCYSGRAPLEAAARGLKAGPDELIFRCNLVTIGDGYMRDFTAGHITQPEAEQLIADLNRHFADSPAVFHSGVSYRNLMLIPGAAEIDVQCSPPHDIPNEPVSEHWPRGRGAERVQQVMDRAAELLRDHPVNQARAQRGQNPATNIWLWGQGRPTKLEPFVERFGLSGAVITGVDIIRGLAVSMGMKLIEVPGATGYVDTDYAGKGAAAVRALGEYDLVVIHVEAPDEAGHLGDAELKVETLERVDELVVGPVLDALRRHAGWRILVAPDHPTPVATTAHSAVPPAFCFAGTAIRPCGAAAFSEAVGAQGPIIDPGHELMSRFLSA
ncbi:MAG: cofactor-independent phosphoglycerate mutase [Planctomycetes bacterium]|nr:cofactor-independent phosphoglycerate mutase [Planctomycetota bacterium]